MKPPVPDRRALPSRTPGPYAAFRSPGAQTSRKPKAEAAAGRSRIPAAPGSRRCPRPFPPPPPPLPSAFSPARSRKRPGHIEPLQIRR